jgi:transcriptional regulator with XRE-family HTH domain
MSQAKLAEALGLTFQQIQKYERGTNRVSASRLVDIAQALDVPIGFFFDDLPGNKIFGACSDCVTVIEGANGNGAPRQETQTLLRAYYSISDLNIRKRMLALVKSLAAGCGPIPASRDEARLRSLIGELGDRPVPERGGPGPSGVTIEPE